MAADDIKKEHRLYTANKPKWKLVVDCAAGEDAVKAEKEKYLPYPVAIPADVAATEKFRNKYKVYLENASFTNFVEQTNEELVAGCFKRDVILGDDFPENIAYINVNDLARAAVDLDAALGRCFLLADYPTAPTNENGQPLTKAQEEALDLRAFVSVYHPLAVINWSTRTHGGNEILTRVVLAEGVDTDDGEATHYRELIIDPVTKKYKVRVHEFDAKEQFLKITETTPKMGGKEIDFIPGVFVGAVNNTSKVDKIPLLGIAQTNIKHYRTMAELFYVQTGIGHPQLVVTGVESGATQDDEGNKVKVEIEVGTTDALLFEGGETDAKFLEINAANLIHFKTLEQLEKSMLEQGARLKSFNMKAGVESAEALKMRSSANISTLAKIAKNCERGLGDVLWWCHRFMGGAEAREKITLDINKEFFDMAPDPAVMTGISGMVGQGQAPDYVAFDYMRKTGLVDEKKTDDELRADIEETRGRSIGMNTSRRFPGNNDNTGA